MLQALESAHEALPARQSPDNILVAGRGEHGRRHQLKARDQARTNASRPNVWLSPRPLRLKDAKQVLAFVAKVGRSPEQLEELVVSLALHVTHACQDSLLAGRASGEVATRARASERPQRARRQAG